MQLKLSIPTRTSNLIGLSDIRTMTDFWSHMDNEYLDYNALSRSAIADVKNLDRTNKYVWAHMPIVVNVIIERDNIYIFLNILLSRHVGPRSN